MRQLKITKSITNRESASLDKYLQEIGREDLITVEEEVELAQRIRKGVEPSGSHTSTVKYCLSSAGTNTLGMNLKLHAESTSSKTMQAIVA